ncbi:uncharacterized protein CPUR_08758 [Claviceps purpurea 20.1]|uniref:Uncharacterized protein n=1 Tax=Claviceps purpurea (strain 20.1) TaxID=1111077 RepID=M1WIP1_CLAP2|nr:uncharacterized protein CPUR_08758 [Claviceps purpurea 20.1]
MAPLRFAKNGSASLRQKWLRFASPNIVSLCVAFHALRGVSVRIYKANQVPNHANAVTRFLIGIGLTAADVTAPKRDTLQKEI